MGAGIAWLMHRDYRAYKKTAFHLIYRFSISLDQIKELATSKVNTMTQPIVQHFFDEPTNTFSYVVRDPDSQVCAILDSVLDWTSPPLYCGCALKP